MTPADLKTQLETYASLIAAAADGSKKAITERKKQRAVVVKMLRQLGHWVEANCNDDAAILQSSGYQQVSTVRTPSQPLAGPPFFKVDNGPNSGQAVVHGKPVFGAASYVVRYAPIGPDGKAGTWAEVAGDGNPFRYRHRPDARHELCVSSTCPGPAGLHGLERLRHSDLAVSLTARPLSLRRQRAGKFASAYCDTGLFFTS